ncbi:MAG: phosphoethanolamine--lipid A transferase [Candidatus Accumulibacter sp.]|jgi:lipid A ethanolaminephosphotransferase|nr:phosphoethanolamine--lipid A transferase [Accumulibacter sp.]
MKYSIFPPGCLCRLSGLFRAIPRMVSHWPCDQEFLILAVSFWITLTCNAPLWRAVLKGRDLTTPDGWLFFTGFGVSLTALHFLPPALLGSRRTLKACLALFLCIASIAGFFMERFGIFIDSDMARNVVRTDSREAGEFLTWGLFVHLAIFLAFPLFILQRIELTQRSLKKAIFMRGTSLATAVVFGAAGLMLNFQTLAAMMRNHKEIRYLITPGNVIYSFVRVLSGDSANAPPRKQAVAPDASLGPAWKKRKKPVLFVIVAGETARAANWGNRLGPDGAPRQTTPELDKQDIISFPQATSCGTSTEISLPCMFSPLGRRRYNEKAINASESLLHVLERAGFRIVWRDNQSGCKGVCSGLEEQRLHKSVDAELCDGTYCLDEILLKNLETLTNAQENLVLTLHPLGNHGPAYYKRYPPAFRRFTPTCDTADLSKCGKEEIINSYDNAIMYSDHFLARVIAFLQAQEKEYDTALFFASDHGESLGENGLFLHGMPYAIAPKEQKHVPMFIWFSTGYARAFGLNTACLRRVAENPVSHDNLFHTVLGMLDIDTRARDPDLDLSAACRGR